MKDGDRFDAHHSLDDRALDQLFLQARSHNSFSKEPVPLELLHKLYQLTAMGPTSSNCCPLRVIFLTTARAKDALLPALNAGNVEKSMGAPVVALLANDLQFHRRARELFPHRPEVMDRFEHDHHERVTTAMRNGTLQAGYFLMAARALGLDVGPMSGFNEHMVNERFFGKSSVRVNFLCNLGRGDGQRMFPRLPRLAFEQACEVL